MTYGCSLSPGQHCWHPASAELREAPAQQDRAGHSRQGQLPSSHLAWSGHWGWDREGSKGMGVFCGEQQYLLCGEGPGGQIPRSVSQDTPLHGPASLLPVSSRGFRRHGMDWRGEIILGWLVQEQLSLHPSGDTQCPAQPPFPLSPCKADWQLNVSLGTVPGSDPPRVGWAGCPQGCGTDMERWHSSAQSPEVSLSGGAGCSWGSCWGVQPGAAQAQAGAVWSGRTPVVHSLLPHEDSSQEWWVQQLEPDFVPAHADGSSLGSPGREAVRKGAF